MNHNNTDQEINLEEKGEEFILIQRFGYGVDIHQLSRVEFDFLSMIDWIDEPVMVQMRMAPH